MKLVPPNFGYVEDGIFRCGLPEPRHYSFLSSLRLKTCILLTDTPHLIFHQWLVENGVRVLCPLAGAALTTSQALRDGAAAGVRDLGGSNAGTGSAGPSSAVASLAYLSTAGELEGSSAPRKHPSAMDPMLSQDTWTQLPSSLLEDPWTAVVSGAGGGVAHGMMTLPEPIVVSTLEVLLDERYYPLLLTCPKGRYRTGLVCGCLRKIQRWNLVSILEEYRRYAGDKSRAENEEFIELFDVDLVNTGANPGSSPLILYRT